MYDLIIIGSGPAGLSASVYAKRAGLNALTLDSSPISGGQVLNTYEVDNYLGFNNVSGMELCKSFRDHADALGCGIVNEEVINVSKSSEGFIVKTSENEYETYAVVFATGASHASLGVKGEEDLSGMGVSYCATCDGAFFRGRDVAVIGGGDVAVEDAIYLSRTCKKVYLVHRRDSLRAAKMLQDDLMRQDNIEVIWNSTVESINGEDMVEGITVNNKVTGETSTINVNGVFIAIGMNPVNSLISDLVTTDEKGFVVSCEDCTSSTPGIFVAGDLRTKPVRQIVTAVADGANVISSVEGYLRTVKQ